MDVSRIHRCRRSLVFLLISWGLTAVSIAHAGQEGDRVFRAGAATSNITPPLGEPIVGNWNAPPATHVHDELHARCLVLDDGETRIAIVLCDNVGIARDVLDVARILAEESSGIPGQHILLASTHTHSATPARGLDRLAPMDDLSGYPAFLARRIADGVVRASANLEPARIGWGRAEVPGQVFNRRWFLNPDREILNPFGGTDRVKMNPPRATPDLREPAGPTDPEVVFLSVQAVDGRPIALLANYSLHYVGGVPSGHVSADYFGVFAERIGQLLDADRVDPPFVGVMSNGTSGDINNIDFRATGQRLEPYEKIRQVADEVAEAVHQAHQSVTFHSWVPLGAVTRELTLAARVPDEELRDFAQRTLAKPEEAPRDHPLERIYAERVLRAVDAPEEVSILLQAVRIGGVGIAAIPFEVFVETGLELKARSPFEQTFTIELANGSYGYLPTPRHHDLGGYETWFGTNRVERDASERIRDGILELFGALQDH
ncbi:neutral/alkaline non-lysosomal ceramidase N-terminal domain-containing protein [Tautonia rosea]|uniref:neutral/alkaline non-lysosomal ceramidase N-terminal domain-containing protein n=1 Tax=Tautonia rosea TaxID=2728037 RepID=UPI00147640AA|nr:neutral/alkaline non-lysosomal ceramidase N-terminal domain-containing protein [Tautonia rosea]